MHRRLHDLVDAAGGSIADIVHCPHGPDDGCDCRKSLPGLLEQLGTRLEIEDLTGSWMVGDSLRDLQAGEAVGCHPVLVRTGKGQKTRVKHPELAVDGKTRLFDDLAAFTDWLLGESP
jgi:D-glycero-D-manno-heptose 1,7-bisphosphate phosphatase